MTRLLSIIPYMAWHPWPLHAVLRGQRRYVEPLSAIMLDCSKPCETRIRRSTLERVMHVARYAMCMDGQGQRHPGVRRDPDLESPPGCPRARA
jgi:hypothetical protein